MEYYEKKYKTAIAEIRDLFERGSKEGWTLLAYKKEFKTIFPELQEDEDERILEVLLEYFDNNDAPFGECDSKDVVDWLKRYGRKITIYGNDEDIKEKLRYAVRHAYVEGLTKEECLAWIDRQKDNKNENNEDNYWPKIVNCIHDCTICDAKCFYRKQERKDKNIARNIRGPK